jgi:hydrogenase-4 component H
MFVTEEFRGRPLVDPEKCVGCGSCILVCPAGARRLIQEEDRYILRYFIGQCIFCWRCVEICPEKAISGTTEFFFATDNWEDLFIDIKHKTVKCSYCGKTFVPQKLIINTKNKLPSEFDFDRLDICPDCKKNIGALKISISRGIAYEDRK